MINGKIVFVLTENLLYKHINRYFPFTKRGLRRLMEGNTSVQIIIIDCACLGKLNFMDCNFSLLLFPIPSMLLRYAFVCLIPIVFHTHTPYLFSFKREKKHTARVVFLKYRHNSIRPTTEQYFLISFNWYKSRIQTTLKQITFSIIDILNVVLILLPILFSRFVEMTITTTEQNEGIYHEHYLINKKEKFFMASKNI